MQKNILIKNDSINFCQERFPKPLPSPIVATWFPLAPFFAVYGKDNSVNLRHVPIPFLVDETVAGREQVQT